MEKIRIALVPCSNDTFFTINSEINIQTYNTFSVVKTR